MAGPCTSGFWRWMVLVLIATTATVTGQVCQSPFGMESGAIPDDSITASGVGHHYALDPHLGRLNGTTHYGAWGPALHIIGQWLQVFTGNTDTKNPVTHLLDNPVHARYVRFYPQSWYGYIAMRVEILGCNTEIIWGLTLNDAGMSHLNVSWTVVGNLPISRYTLRYQPSDGSGPYQDLSPAPGAGDTSATVLGLMDHTEYTLTLTSFDENNQPNGVINETFTTGGRRIIIWGLTLNDAGMSHLNVSWTVVGNLPISRYTLRYQPSDGSGPYQDLSPAPGAGDTSATVLGLMDHTEYTLTLTSFDENNQPNGVINETFTTVCQNPLGMEDGAISDDSITAFSVLHHSYVQPYFGRLKGTAGWGAWTPARQDNQQWLQVDLGVIKRVTGIPTQGAHLPVNNHYSWVRLYKLEYSGDEFFWTTCADKDGSDKVFTGNTDTKNPVTHLLDNPVHARYVRFYPQSWYGYIAMRVEILGCNTEIIWGLTLNDAGMSHLNVSWTVVGNLPISRYTLRYQPSDGSGPYQDLSPAPGAGDTSATVLGLMDHTEYTLTLISFDEDNQSNGVINGTFTTVCQSPLGMESGAIPDDNITASGVGHHHYLQPYFGRLKGTAGWGGWAPAHQNRGQWLQVDLGVIKRVTGITTQGALQLVHHRFSWVFAGNTDTKNPVTNLLENPVDARFVRIYPQSWYHYIAMRMEILGCSTD
ncbi:PREDICTED: fibronectin-like, partial [Branchiostoma belcheri]|uniref:Fibronectin-like n=1 Tax=Branchiostoma belcheri TaxID=7741 RepID=A0A6P4ZWY6_BRABE